MLHIPQSSRAGILPCDCERVDVGYVWEVRRRQTATYWPQVPLTIAALLSHSFWAAQPGSWEPKPSVWSWFSLRGHPISNWNCNSNWTGTDSNSNWLQLKPSVAPSYIIAWHAPASCGRTYLHQIQPRPQVKVIFRHPRPDAPVSWLTARSRVNMLQSELIVLFTFKWIQVFLSNTNNPCWRHVMMMINRLFSYN